MRWTAATALLCLPALLGAAPTAEEILEKARKALGVGGSLHALAVEGVRRVSVETPDGPGSMTRTSQMQFLRPDKFLRSETVEMPGGMEGPTIVEGLDGSVSWRRTENAPSGGNLIIRTMPPGGAGAEGPAAEEARTRLLRQVFLRHWLLYTLTPPAGTEVQFEYQGEAETPDGKAWVIDATGPDRFALRLFLDQSSNLPVMASWRGMQAAPVMRLVRGAPPAHGAEEPPRIEPPKPKEVEYQVRLAEYARQGGILMPKLMQVSLDGKLTEEFELKSVKVNPNLKAEKFRK